MLRGITMLLVIYSHICYKLFESYPESHINNIFVTFRMPLFFFVSGFFMYSDRVNYDLYCKRLINRLVMQLYPTLIWLAVFCAISSVYYINALSSPFKEGYWFTFVSVEMYILIGSVIFGLNELSLNKSTRTKILLCIAIVSAILCVIFRKSTFSESFIFEMLSVDPLTHFTPYLCLGCIFKIFYNDFLGKYLLRRYLIAAIIVFVLSILFPQYSLYTLLPAISGIYILHYVCYKLYSICGRSKLLKKVVESLAYIGTLTLEIYLLHYIIIHYIKIIWPELILIGKKACNTLIEFPLYLSISIIIAAICITLVEFLKFCKIYALFFPKKDSINKLTERLKQHNLWTLMK